MDKMAKPKEIMALLGLDLASTRVVKRDTLLVGERDAEVGVMHASV